MDGWTDARMHGCTDGWNFGVPFICCNFRQLLSTANRPKSPVSQCDNGMGLWQ